MIMKQQTCESESVLEPRMPISNKLLVNSDVGDPQSSLWEPQDHFLLLDFQLKPLYYREAKVQSMKPFAFISLSALDLAKGSS